MKLLTVLTIEEILELEESIHERLKEDKEYKYDEYVDEADDMDEVPLSLEEYMQEYKRDHHNEYTLDWEHEVEELINERGIAPIYYDKSSGKFYKTQEDIPDTVKQDDIKVVDPMLQFRAARIWNELRRGNYSGSVEGALEVFIAKEFGLDLTVATEISSWNVLTGFIKPKMDALSGEELFYLILKALIGIRNSGINAYIQTAARMACNN
ncbi:MAG: hypothetical protein ATN35_03250 [Epulopiscium sp. Nele67-Bin004]|nr:MAG: hypothetical protein ATN35_03250 [Epulopiscium sp. Nele67-Bin004]